MTSASHLPDPPPGRVGLVLGAGGVIGMASTVGVLRALEDLWGWAPGSADLIVGTSSGAVLATQLRLGRSPAELSEVARTLGQPGLERHPLDRAWTDPLDLARRIAGAAWVTTRARMPTALPAPPDWLGRAFPGHLWHVGDRDRFDELVPEAWPARAVWLVASDLDAGTRVALGRHEHHRRQISLRRAVLASCAVPGVYRPVRIGRRTFVDGGVHSSTNLDLVAGEARHIVCVAPATAARWPRSSLRWTLLRASTSASLALEAWYARANGSQVTVLSPARAELRRHPMNLLRTDRTDEVEAAAYEATRSLLSSAQLRATREALMASSAPAGIA